eukprot:3609027-Pleurochrysis_carterae.AAC.1
MKRGTTHSDANEKQRIATPVEAWQRAAAHRNRWSAEGNAEASAALALSVEFQMAHVPVICSGTCARERTCARPRQAGPRRHVRTAACSTRLACACASRRQGGRGGASGGTRRGRVAEEGGESPEWEVAKRPGGNQAKRPDGDQGRSG